MTSAAGNLPCPLVPSCCCLQVFVPCVNAGAEGSEDLPRNTNFSGIHYSPVLLSLHVIMAGFKNHVLENNPACVRPFSGFSVTVLRMSGFQWVIFFSMLFPELLIWRNSSPDNCPLGRAELTLLCSELQRLPWE